MSEVGRRCPNCSAPAGEKDRVCYACHRPLVNPAARLPTVATPAVIPPEPEDPSPPIESVPSGPTANDKVFEEPLFQTVSAPSTLGETGTPAPVALESAPVTSIAPSTSTRSAEEPLSIALQWGRTTQRVEVPAGGATIGSTSAADIVIPATFLDPVHAQISWSDGRWMIESRSAAGQVLLHGASTTRSPLELGDVVRLADRIGNFATIKVESGRSGGIRASELRGTLPLPGQTIVIGSDRSCAIRLEHALVRPRHATLRREPDGSLFLDDRVTVAGTYVNGARLKGRRRIEVGDVIQIGPFSARVSATHLDGLDQVPGIDVNVQHASVDVVGHKSPKRLLTDVTLHLPAASMTAIAGPSGAGKTTLMRLLSGQLSASEGTVQYNGVPLAECRQAYAGLMGFVPQDDVVHPDLSVDEALGYQARLRLGRQSNAEDRRARIDQALGFVGLLDQRKQLVKTLSGGQRKRVSIASELLNDPEILFLDEPTSGLDPGLDKRMMLLLRLLADQGRTVILTTHAISHVDVCESLVLVGPGGRVIYADDPEKAPTWFNVPSLGDAFALIDTPAASATAAARVTGASGANRTPTPSTRPRPQDSLDHNGAAPVRPSFGSPAWREIVFYFGRIFTGRYVRILGRDRVALAFSLLQGVVVALLTALVAPHTTNGFDWTINGSSPMFVLGCSAVWFGMINSVRELVKERTIWRREELAGASVAAYLASKVVVLGTLAAVQSLTMLLVLQSTLHLPLSGPLTSPFVTIGVTLWLANVCGMALGLLVSAVAPSSDRAMSIVPYLLITQLVLCGVLFPLHGLTVVSYLMPARWAVTVLGGVAGLYHADSPADIYVQSGGMLVLAWVVLIGLSSAGLFATARILHRQAARWSVG